MCPESRVEWDAFVASVEDALAHLYDLTDLAGHELRAALGRNTSGDAAERLHRDLVDAIGSLRPTPGSPPTSTSWRRYRYLERRYLAGLSHKAVAAELGLSVRQAHRVRTEAIETIARVLRDASPRAMRGSPARPTDGIPRGELSVPRPRGTLDDELARLGREGSSSPSDLAKETQEALATVRPLAQQRGVAIDLNLPGGSWPVAADRAQLRQAIVLALSYAIDRSATGRIWLAIDDSPPRYPLRERSRDVLPLSLRSEEGGLAEHQITLDVVLEPRAASLGSSQLLADPRLDAARRLVEAQGGTLEAVDGGGATVLRLGLNPAKTATVLTIDDNPDLAQLFELYLQGTRFRVARAKTGSAALRLASQGGVDVITLDVMMPFQDGWEIFRQLRANPATREIPIVVCSILPEKDLALALGAADFLAKPVTREALVRVLHRCCPRGSAASPDPV